MTRRRPSVSVHENRRCGEVEVRAVHARTIRLVRQTAGGHVRVVLRHLLMPEHPAGAEVQRDESIARVAGGLAVVVAGRDVQRVSNGIDGRARPHGRTGRPPQLRPDLVLRRRLRRLRDHVALPDLLAGRRVERDDASAKLAALVRGDRAGRFFTRRDRDVHPAVVVRGRSADARHREVFDARLPLQGARRGVNGVGVARLVAEEREVACADARNRHRRADAGGRLVKPVNAAGRGAD